MKRLVTAYKELDAKFEERNPLNLKRKFPTYINRPVFRIAFLVVLALIITDFCLNGYSFTRVSIACPEDYAVPCVNPFYRKEPTNLYTPIETSSYIKNVCGQVPCDKKYLQPGESYGRDDFLANHGVGFIFLIFIFALLVNHVIYLTRKNHE